MSRQNHIEVISRGLIRSGSHLLVCRNVRGGYTYLPGGHVEFGEPAAAALAREIREETGLDLDVGVCALVSEGVFETGGARHHEINLVFHGELRLADSADRGSLPVVGSLEAGISFEWIDLAMVVDSDLRPEAIRAWLASGGASTETCGWASAFADPTQVWSKKSR